MIELVFEQCFLTGEQVRTKLYFCLPLAAPKHGIALSWVAGGFLVATCPMVRGGVRGRNLAASLAAGDRCTGT